MAHGVKLVQDGITEPDLVAWAFGSGGEERNSAGGFSENVLSGRVNQRDHGSSRVQAQGGQLGKGGKGAIAAILRAEFFVVEAFVADGVGIDETLGVQPRAVVSLRAHNQQKRGVGGFKKCRRQWHTGHAPVKISLSGSLGVGANHAAVVMCRAYSVAYGIQHGATYTVAVGRNKPKYLKRLLQFT